MESPKSVCKIDIMFPVKSDDEAIDIKKKIAESLKDVEQIRIQFTIMER